MARFAQSLLTALLLSVMLFGLPFAWILRDGLGPDAVESSGLEAVWRCLKTFHVGLVLVVLALLAWTARVLSARDREQRNEAAER